MRVRAGVVAAALVMVFAGSAAAQVRVVQRPVVRRPVRPRQPRVRVLVSGALQATRFVFEDNQTFQQYLESGSFKFSRTIPKRPLFDVGAGVRVYRRLHVGMSLSFLNDTGTGSITAEVPHPLFFNQKRTVTADIQNVIRKETGAHFQASWTTPPVNGLEFSFFGGPSIFIAEQTYVTQLALGLDKETYPFDTFAFAGATTATFKDNIPGYNAGVDMTWKFSKHVGAGVLIRYAAGKRTFTPTGGAPITVEVGGLHAGGGFRFIL
jgi:hypothetical protein